MISSHVDCAMRGIDKGAYRYIESRAHYVNASLAMKIISLKRLALEQQPTGREPDLNHLQHIMEPTLAPIPEDILRSGIGAFLTTPGRLYLIRHIYCAMLSDRDGICTTYWR